MTSALSRWLRDPGIRALWRASWNEPHMQIGLQVLQELVGNVVTAPIPGIDYVQLSAINGARREGFQRAVDSIRRLGTEKDDQTLEAKIDAEEWAGWGHVNLNAADPAPAAAKQKPDPTQDT